MLVSPLDMRTACQKVRAPRATPTVLKGATHFIYLTNKPVAEQSLLYTLNIHFMSWFGRVQNWWDWGTNTTFELQGSAVNACLCVTQLVLGNSVNGKTFRFFFL